MTAVTADKAVFNANATTTNVVGMCLKYVRGWLEIPGRYPDAISAWNAATHKHRGGIPPRGAPVFFAGGSHGHIALSIGLGSVRSTDTPRSGRVGTEPLNWWHDNWGDTYLGWTEDLNGVLIPWLAPPPPPPAPGADMTVAELDAYLASPQGQKRLVAAILAYKNTAITDSDVYAHIVHGSGLPLK